MWSGTNNNVYRPRTPYLHSSLSRTLYERMQMDYEMRNFDKNIWYRCELDQFGPSYVSTFVQLDCDQQTEEFLKICHEKADALFVNIFQTLAATLLTFFMTKTSINGLLGRGSMFIFSHPQLERLLDLPPAATGVSEWRGDTMLDLGAGDGKVTEIMATYFRQVHATEASSVMRGILAKKGYQILELDRWHEGEHKYDVISCLNLLDRCDRPISMLSQMAAKIKVDSGRLVVAVVVPFQPYVEFGANGSTQPVERLPAMGSTFQEQVQAMVEQLFAPAGLELVRWTKLPYLCEGNLNRSYYWLTDVLYVLKLATPTPTGTCHNADQSAATMSVAADEHGTCNAAIAQSPTRDDHVTLDMP